MLDMGGKEKLKVSQTGNQRTSKPSELNPMVTEGGTVWKHKRLLAGKLEIF